MLESFVLREEDSVRVQQEDLRAVTTAVFTKMGVPFDDAALAADVLLLADIRGVDSHGVSNMLRSYMQGYQAGGSSPSRSGGWCGNGPPPPTSTPMRVSASSSRPRRWRWRSRRQRTPAWAS